MLSDATVTDPDLTERHAHPNLGTHTCAPTGVRSPAMPTDTTPHLPDLDEDNLIALALAARARVEAAERDHDLIAEIMGELRDRSWPLQAIADALGYASDNTIRGKTRRRNAMRRRRVSADRATP